MRTSAVSLPQLPVYVPSEAEKKDPALYASNVRDMMLRVGGFKASPASLQDSRAYIALLQARLNKPNKHVCVAGSAAPRVPHPPFSGASAHQLCHMQTCRHVATIHCLYRLLIAVSLCVEATALSALRDCVFARCRAKSRQRGAALPWRWRGPPLRILPRARQR